MASNARLKIVTSEPAASEELQAHEETYQGFSRLVLFAVLHIVLVLGCMALGFVGHVPVIAVTLGLGGTAALLAAFALTS